MLNVPILIQQLSDLHNFLDETRNQHKQLRNKTGQAIQHAHSMVLNEQSSMSHRRMRIDDAFKQFKHKQEALQTAQQRHQESSTELNQLRTEAGELGGQLDNLHQEINAAKQDAQQKLQEATEHHTQCAEEHRQALQERNEAQQQVSRLRGIVSQLDSKLRSVESRIDSIHSAISRCPPGQDPSGLFRQLDNARRQAGETAAYLRKAQNDLADAEDHLAQMRQKVEDCKQKEDEAFSKKRMREGRMNKISQLHSQAMPLSSTRQYANQALDTMEKHLGNAAQSLKAATQYNQQGVEQQQKIEEGFATSQKVVEAQRQMVDALQVADRKQASVFNDRDRLVAKVNSTIKTESDVLRKL